MVLKIEWTARLVKLFGICVAFRKEGSTSELEFSPFRRGLDFSSSASRSLRDATLVDCWSRRSIKEQLDIMLVKSWIEQSYGRQTSAQHDESIKQSHLEGVFRLMDCVSRCIVKKDVDCEY